MKALAVVVFLVYSSCSGTARGQTPQTPESTKSEPSQSKPPKPTNTNKKKKKIKPPPPEKPTPQTEPEARQPTKTDRLGPGVFTIAGTIEGTVTDQAGAVVPGALVSVQNSETGVIRTATTDKDGHYTVLALALGVYEIRVKKDGFKEELFPSINLLASRATTLDVALRVGDSNQQVVSIDVEQLPPNGRDYAQLAQLSPGVRADAGISNAVSFPSVQTSGAGISNSTMANSFAVNGNGPQQNLFLLNGVEYTGGTSGMLLGVDAIGEFSVEQDSYGAEFGKHPGSQVVIVTKSGSNDWHGSVYEFLRNNAFDARNFFDSPGGPPPFQRNQFGASLGEPLRKDRTFAFVNYEGFRQNLHQTSAAFVPDNASRAAAAPSVQSLLNLWPAPSASAPDFNGIAEVFSSPLQTIREDFGTARLDHNFSDKDRLSAIYTVDDGRRVTASPANPYSTDLQALRDQVFSLENNYTFSPTLLNMTRFGYSRAAYFFTGEPTPGTLAGNVPGFLTGLPVGAVVVGGGTASNPQAQIGLGGSNNASNLRVARNLYTIEDRVTLVRGRNQLNFGVWFQPFQSNETLALSQYGQATFTSLATFLAGNISSFLFDPTPTEMNWRSFFGAWYAEDVIRVTRKLTVSLGFRDEFSMGWNEAHGRASTYVFNNGLIQTQPHIGDSLFTTNNAKVLLQPRAGVSWMPFGERTAIRAAFGIYNDLQDALGYHADQNAPFNPTYSVPFTVAQFPINPNGPIPAAAMLMPGGVQPNMQTPTLISWSLRVQHGLSSNTSVTIGYVGSHGYHELIGIDANEPFPVICPAAPCPATYPVTFPAGLAGTPVPAGSYFVPTTVRANPALANTWSWFSEGNSSYNALQADVNGRFSSGLAFRGLYTYSKALDDGDSVNATTSGGGPAVASNPFNLRSDWGLASYDVRNTGLLIGSYSLPFGHGRRFFSDLTGAANAAVSGWMLNSIVTLQGGFPFSPQLSYNPSNNGDTRNPVRPFLNPAFKGPIVIGSPNEWFNPNAFLAPSNTAANGGFYGNVGRNTLIGPGLATWDFSVVKDTKFRERIGVQFRTELFNILNHANFNQPNQVVFTPSGISPTAGAITSTSTTSRQVQFGLKLSW